MVENPPANAGELGSILGSGRSPEEEMATHSSIVAWEIPWTEEPGGLQSDGGKSAGHDLVTKQQQFPRKAWGQGKFTVPSNHTFPLFLLALPPMGSRHEKIKNDFEWQMQLPRATWEERWGCELLLSKWLSLWVSINCLHPTQSTEKKDLSNSFSALSLCSLSFSHQWAIFHLQDPHRGHHPREALPDSWS